VWKIARNIGNECHRRHRRPWVMNIGWKNEKINSMNL
jgi:hypothetical protein